MRALLLAAGLGTRLKPLTDEWPKCLMPIAARPLLEYWLSNFQAMGIPKVLVNTSYHSNIVQNFLARPQFSNWVGWVYESRLLGTAGTLVANLDFFRGHTTLLVHADNWCQCDFSEFVNYHFFKRQANCPITMMTFKTDSPQECGILETDSNGVVVALHEKVAKPPGNLANAAVYLLQPEVIEWLGTHPHLSDFSNEVLPQFIGRIATWHNSGIHRDIGTFNSLRAAQDDPLPSLCWAEKDDWQRNFESTQIFKNLMSKLLAQKEHDE